MKHRLLIHSIAVFFAAAAISSAASNEALLDLLVKKKVISSGEADRVAAEIQKEEAGESASKLKLSSSVTELKLSGDLRLRYQYDNRDFQVDPPGVGGDEDRSPSGSQRSFWRFRLRLNADFKLGEDFFGGVQLVTGQASDSDNQTFENGFSDYGIFISRAYLGWHATDWLTLVGGKQPNPLYTTELVWDSDINPTGVSAAFKFHELFPAAGSESYSKDGKTVSSKPGTHPWELTLNVGGFIYDDNNEDAFDNDASDDAYILAAQLVGSWKFNKNLKVTFAPGVQLFNAADYSGFNNANAFSDVPGVSGEGRKLTILNAPGDVAFKIGNLKTKFYWDFAYNAQGQERFDDIYGLFYPNVPKPGKIDANPGFESFHDTEDDFAYLVGIQFGELKKAGDWQLYVNWRQTGISSIDPNLNDSDFALSEINTRGVKTGLFYSFTDFLNAGIAYSYAWNLKDNLVGGQATGGAALADSNAIQVFQVDLNVKF
jgi:hypothetical protein